MEEIDKEINKLKDEDLSIDEMELISKKMDEILSKQEESIQNIWNEPDKLLFKKIMTNYFDLNVRNNISIKLLNLLSKNELFKLMIQFLIFLFTFLGTYVLSPLLETYYSSLGTFGSQFIIALLLFLTLERILQLLDEWLLVWRVKKSFESYARLLPVIKEVNEFLNKNNKDI